MSTLVVRIEPTNRGAAVDPSQPLRATLVARLTRLTLPSHGASVERVVVADGPATFELLLGIGGRGSAVEVGLGVWNVELALPSGELLARQVRVEPDDEAEVVFDLGAAPRDWLSWQFVEGSVPDRERYEEVLSTDEAGALQSPRGVTRAGPRRLSKASRRSASRMFGTPVVESDAFALSGGSRTATALAQVSLLTSGAGAGPGAAGADAPTPGAAAWWSGLAAGLRMEDDIKRRLVLATDPEAAFVPGEDDRWHQVWRISGEPGEGRRRFALVVSSWAAELVSLPLPWTSRRSPTWDGAPVELVIDKSEVGRPSRTSVTLRDPDLFGLLSYLKSGAFASAGLVARRGSTGVDLLVELMRRKRANPLAACAAGYALLAGTDLRKASPWQDWLTNLDDWFEEVPDGALLRGRLMLARGEAGDEAKEAFLRAFARGVPFYALGLAWMLEGLRQFADDRRCLEAASLVREVAVRSDVSQAFTVLRLRPPADLGVEG